MTDTKQSPIPSGYDRSTTVAEVLAGVDLTGRTAIVTGGYSGLGLEVTRGLAGRGASVVVPARRPAEAARRLTGVPGVQVAELDLADTGSVRSFAAGFRRDATALDILVNNAGVLSTGERRVGPGWEEQFAVNHLGHYALTSLLRPALVAARGGARVVTVSSWGHKASAVRFEDVMSTRSYDMLIAYAQSKTANSLFAVQLDLLGRDSGIRSFAAAPGSVLTPLLREVPRGDQVEQGWIDEQGRPNDRFVTAEQGAATLAWAATSPQLDGMGGVYCERCDIAPRTAEVIGDATMAGVDDHAIDRQDAARLWALSAQLTGIDTFGEAV
jgi:NAD(P)-dependent dehydrogenase (short-subunit alcohol dehydrogenase family)